MRPFPEGARFDYQLGGAYPPEEGVRVVVRDVTESPAAGLYSICYINAFQTQPGEVSSWLSAGVVLTLDGVPVRDPEWPDEVLLDTGTEAKRSVIAARLSGDLQRCAEQGYEAVELDNLDSYERSGGLLAFEDNLALADRLLRQGHDLGLLVGQKNAAAEAQALKEFGFDFAIAEQCVEFNECDAYTDPYGAAVFAIEYPGTALGNPCDDEARPTATVLRDRDLVTPGENGYFYRPC